MGTRVNFNLIFITCQNDLDLGFSADPIYRERINSAERVNDPIKLRSFNWRVPALATIQACEC